MGSVGSMQRLAAEDWNVRNDADNFPFVEHTTDDVFVFLIPQG